MVLVFTVAVLWFMNQAVTPKDATWEDVEAEALTGKYELLTTDQLWAMYSDPATRPILVDTRQAWEYRTGHIAGALNFPMEPTWLSRWQKKTALETFLGPDRLKPIVFY